jgi:acyl-CoA thioesterase I
VLGTAYWVLSKMRRREDRGMSGFSQYAARSTQYLAALLLTAALASCGDKPPQLQKLAPSDVVLAFGDSLTYGTGAGPEESYPKILAGLIDRPVVGAGVPGETTGEGLERLPAVLDEVKPKLLLLCLGGNDMLRQMSRASIESNLRAMIEMARARGVQVVLIGVPEPALFGGTVPLYDKLAAELKVPYEKNILATVLFDRELKSDQIHPNARGYARVAQALADLLRKAGAV